MLPFVSSLRRPSLLRAVRCSEFRRAAGARLAKSNLSLMRTPCPDLPACSEILQNRRTDLLDEPDLVDVGNCNFGHIELRRSPWADRLELRLLFIAQRCVEIVKGRAYQLDRLQHGVEPFTDCCEPCGWRKCIVRLA